MRKIISINNAAPAGIHARRGSLVRELPPSNGELRKFPIAIRIKSFHPLRLNRGVLALVVAEDNTF
jgi:hypothetical protein